MKYINRAGDRIDSSQWGKLYRDASYSTVCVSRRGPLEIMTSWVGIQSEHEKQPRLFVVQVRKGTIAKVGNEMREEFSLVSEEWYDTEKTAMVGHRLLAGSAFAKA